MLNSLKSRDSLRPLILRLRKSRDLLSNRTFRYLPVSRSKRFFAVLKSPMSPQAELNGLRYSYQTTNKLLRRWNLRRTEAVSRLFKAEVTDPKTPMLLIWQWLLVSEPKLRATKSMLQLLMRKSTRDQLLARSVRLRLLTRSSKMPSRSALGKNLKESWSRAAASRLTTERRCLKCLAIWQVEARLTKKP